MNNSRYMIPLWVSFGSFGLAILLEPETLVKDSVFFWVFALSFLFSLLNLRFDWLKSWRK